MKCNSSLLRGSPITAKMHKGFLKNYILSQVNLQLATPSAPLSEHVVEVYSPLLKEILTTKPRNLTIKHLHYLIYTQTIINIITQTYSSNTYIKINKYTFFRYTVTHIHAWKFLWRSILLRGFLIFVECSDSHWPRYTRDNSTIFLAKINY